MGPFLKQTSRRDKIGTLRSDRPCLGLDCGAPKPRTVGQLNAQASFEPQQKELFHVVTQGAIVPFG